MKLLRGIQKRAYKIILYAPPGTRKSTFSTNADNPIFIDIENGLARVDCVKTPHIKTWSDFLKALEWVKQDNEFKTVVIDTIDILEQYIYSDICLKEGKASIEKIPYGGGYRIAQSYWNKLLDICDELVSLNKNVIMIAHEEIKTFENPTTDNYNRYSIKIHKNSVNLLIGRVDGVFFVQQEVITNADEKKARTTGDYYLVCNETPAIIAKNRFSLPNKVPMKKEFFDYIANYNGKETK